MQNHAQTRGLRGPFQNHRMSFFVARPPLAGLAMPLRLHWRSHLGMPLKLAQC